MTKIHFLGTCSGTEPVPGMHHCSLVIEVNGMNYWFDAGENCAYSGHTSGIDVLRTAAIFVSHPHPDHIGGMADLLWCMAKLCNRRKETMICDNTLKVFFPGLEVFEAVKTVCCGSKIHKFPFEVEETELSDGKVYEDMNVKVYAVRNRHLRNRHNRFPCRKEEELDRSYSFLILAEGKKIVFSGDVAEPTELDELIGDGCDVLIMETGHHKVEDVCKYAISRKVRSLRFNHHGREIINNRVACEKQVLQYEKQSGISMKICYDKMTEEVAQV